MTSKKQKLRRLLGALKPDEKALLAVDELRDEVKAIKIPDYLPSITAIAKSISVIKQQLDRKIESIPEQVDYTPEINSLSNQLNSLSSQIKDELGKSEVVSSQVLTLQENHLAEIEKLTKELQKVRIEALNKGGGNMNRQIKVEGVDVLTKYTDINLIGGSSSITAVANNTSKRVDITFPSGTSFALTNGSGTTVGADTTSLNLGGELTTNANIGLSSDTYTFSISQTTGGVNYLSIDATSGKLLGIFGDYETNFTVDKTLNRLILNTSGGINFVDPSLPGASNGYVWTLSDKTTGQGAWTASSVAWGNITGTLSNQTDLQTALNAKQDDITGADTRVLFFDGANNPAGDGGLTYNKTTDTLTIAGGLVVDTNTLFVDSTNNRVGINNASPSFALHAVDTTTSASSFKFEFTGWTGAAYTNGIVINSTDASAYYPNHIKLTNAAYGTNGTIFTANNNGIYYSSDVGSVKHIFRDITYNIGTFSTIASEPTLTIANTPAADKIGIAITGHASQTASLQEWQNSSGTPLLKVEADGDLNFGTSGTGGIFGYGGSHIKFSPDAGQNAIRFTPAGGSNYWKTFNSGANLYFQFVPSAGATVFDSYAAALYLGVTSGTGVVIDTSNLVAIGHASPSAQLHVISTSEQFRVGYNTSNYLKTTVASNGSTTFDLAGTNPEFTFADPVTFSGAITLSGRELGKQGVDVASANDLTLGTDGNAYEITGTTQINAITTASWQNGSRITLLFTSNLTVKHNTAGGGGTAVILLAGSADFVASAGDTLSLILSEIGGTQAWREVSRTVI